MDDLHEVNAKILITLIFLIFLIYLFIFFFLNDCVSALSFSCAQRADVRGQHWAASLKAVPTSTTTGVLWSRVSVTLCPPVFHTREQSALAYPPSRCRCNMRIAF